MNEAELIFREIQAAFSGCDHQPVIDDYLKYIMENDVQSIVDSFAKFNSYYYSVLFVKNDRHVLLSRKTAMMLLKSRHKLERQLIRRYDESEY